MKYHPKLSILRSLLFTYSIENFDDPEREIFIASKNINDDKELADLFDELTKPEFIKYTREEREWHINTIQNSLSADEKFESVFYLFDTYFNDEITDKRQFMKILLDCLCRYNVEIIDN
ncbi:hypothetical protein [Pseudomonas sp. SR18]|uniref:hypothetical protein n=1 Tax=Pseudomonas sp. SR18 TaxID=1461074 RepID=UPI00203421EF|nr:hypothetical protein [Pseudomonas sp. SR18]MCM2361455.1 hypothetical protein [Pseudomonas sp. SR18]